MIQLIYTLLIYPIVFLVFRILSFKDSKIRQGFVLRKGKSWIKPIPEGSGVIWFHVASGELEYAKPVIRELKSSGPCFILVTYFSPSVVNALSKTRDVDLFVPMPWDTPWHWNEFLAHYKPEMLAIARTDTWPNMVWQAKKKSVPSILFAATLPGHSGRHASLFGRIFYGRIVEDLEFVSCVSEEDRRNFIRLDPEIKISVDGDTRFDQVTARLAENRELKITKPSGRRIFVAGSTWPEDEDVILPALPEPVSKGLRVIVAPHEPTPAHLSYLELQLNALGLKSSRYSSGAFEQVCIVDQVGVLADLYKFGTTAFVGGSFKKSVHSVMEPAAAGCLTFFGPYHHNNREADILKREGLAREILDSHDLQETLLGELSLPEEKILARKSRTIEFVQEQAGVSRRIADWIRKNKRNSDQARLQR
jgi:3-deoxy-D-manno-octulosonic-acid transferase